jgi:hypothetical protein
MERSIRSLAANDLGGTHGDKSEDKSHQEIDT